MHTPFRRTKLGLHAVAAAVVADVHRYAAAFTGRGHATQAVLLADVHALV
jgi:hypothetical protein